jgi:hypothetical protein
VKILFTYSAETGIKECRIIADNDQEEKHLMEVREKIIELLGSATTVEVTKEELESCHDRNDPGGGKELFMTESATELFNTGGC